MMSVTFFDILFLAGVAIGTRWALYALEAHYTKKIKDQLGR